ncbi:MAG: phospholipase D-like domain-containing protein [Ktedonobacterales bacterium]
MPTESNAPHLPTLSSFDSNAGQADVHPKAIVVDRRRLLVGSANLLMGGLQGNHELVVPIEGSEAARIGRAIDALLASSQMIAL